MRLSPAILAAYAAPALPLAVLYFPVFIYIAPFYASERGVDLVALAAVMLGIRLFDAVSDPLMGWISDRTRPRFGRLRLWLGVSMPMVLLASWQVMVPPEDAGIGHVAIWLAVLTLSWTMAIVPYQALGAELVPDYAGRARVTAWREAAVLIGTLIAAVTYGIASGEGGDAGAGLEAVVMVIVVAFPFTVALILWKVPDPTAARPEQRLSFRAGFAAMRRNAPFRRLLAGYFVNGLANGIPVSLFLFYVAHVLGAPGDAGWLLVLYFICAIAGIPLWTWLARRSSKHRAWGWAMIYACVIFLGVLLLARGDVMAFALISALTGLALGADMALPPAIQADVIDVDTAETGEYRAGVFFAIWSVATKAAVGISLAIAWAILSAVGFDAEARTDLWGVPLSDGFAAAIGNDGSALWTLTLLYAAAPVVLKLGAVALMWNFPIDRAAQEETRRRIEALSP